MTELELVEAVIAAADWDSRVALIRKVPERFGKASHADVYSAIATKVYVPHLKPDFAYVHWREEYELEVVEAAYREAHAATEGFTRTDRETLTASLQERPSSLLIYRLLLGLTPQEFAITTRTAATAHGLRAVGKEQIRSIERAGKCSTKVAASCAAVVDLAMRGELFEPSAVPGVRSKLQKPDTVSGWDTVRRFATEGVPLSTFLHQRHYGGAFRQLLDATASKKGDVLEDAVRTLFEECGIRHLQTGSHNQEEIARRFGVTIRPAPDFVVFDERETLRALLECKSINDGGTARDKAGRFANIREEATRLGGVPVFAVLAGLGWKRTRDALGPVVRDTDGRVFTPGTLAEMMTVEPFPTLARTRLPPTGATDRREAVPVLYVHDEPDEPK